MSGTPKPQMAASATLRITIPAKAKTASSRRPAYVGWATQSVTMAFTVGSTTYPTQAVNVTAGSPNCTTDQNFNVNCTLTFGAAPGNATYTVSAYDGLNGTGKLLSTATASMTVVAGQDNKFNVTLDGVVGGFAVSFAAPNASYSSIPAGTAADVPISVSATDPDNSVILNSPQLLFPDGTPVTSATLVINGDPGEFTLEQNGMPLAPASGTAYTISAPFSGLTLHYNGGPYTDLTLTVNAGSATGQATLHVEPAITEFASPSGVSFNGSGEIAAGPDGNMWLAECAYGARGLAKITPSGGITEYSLQGGAIGCGIASAGGNMWASEGANCPDLCGIEELSTDGTILARVPVYHGGCDPYPGALAADQAGNVWYDNSPCGVIGYLPASARTTEQHFFEGSDGVMAPGPDGKIWYVANDSNYTFALGSVTAAGATQNFDISQTGTGNPPGTIAARASNKTIWVSHQAGSYDVVDTATGVVTNYASGSGAAVITSGNDGNLYAMAYVYSLFGNLGLEFDSIAADGTVSRTYFYGSAAPQGLPDALVAGPPGTNTLWFIDNQTGEIARISLGG